MLVQENQVIFLFAVPGFAMELCTITCRKILPYRAKLSPLRPYNFQNICCVIFHIFGKFSPLVSPPAHQFAVHRHYREQSRKQSSSVLENNLRDTQIHISLQKLELGLRIPFNFQHVQQKRTWDRRKTTLLLSVFPPFCQTNSIYTIITLILQQ